MGKRKGCLIVFLVSLIAAIAFVLASAKSGNLARLTQVVESDGHRQVEYKIFGVIPYEKQEDAPSTQVSGEFWRLMGKFGIKVGPEMDGARITRTVRANETVYWMYKNVQGDHKALVAKYAAQVPKPKPYNREWRYDPPITYGKPALRMFIDLQGSGAKPGTDQCYVGMGITTVKY